MTSTCKLCNGTGWISGKDYSDGSFVTDRPCNCTGYRPTE